MPDVTAAGGQDVDGAPPAEPSRDQIRVLHAIHEQTVDHGGLPSFRVLDKQLDLEGLKLRELVQSMPPGLIRPDLAVGSYILREDDRLSVPSMALPIVEAAPTRSISLDERLLI